MILYVIKKGSSIDSLVDKLGSRGASHRIVELYGRKLVLAWPDNIVEGLTDPSIEATIKTKKPYPLASREWKKEDTIVNVNGVEIGGKRIVIAAGPCSVEDEEQMITISRTLKNLGVSMIRGGAFKPRTSPYSFQGLGEKGLKILRRVSEETGLPVVSEIMDPRDATLFREYVDMVQIGARNSQNFSLLKEVGRIGKPVLLKRGFGNTVDEWLSSAEYILLEGNGSVVICERGIRSFETGTRFTLDVGGIALAKRLTHLPVCADPSHPAGKRDLVAPLALAAIASGADMLLIEVHHNPERALSDSEQQLDIAGFASLMERLRSVARILGRDV
ncbi:3-deoxy-7-phosphoheptulonate synthase [Desulfurococcaceae archaeon AG1]|jgi:3-deoxy-7-phosphoheptulonate synthase|nr:MAG: 3-deoxy-7-phosphoheptulonate synthase [Desulfurococcaceae archaeon]GAY26404.1 3-deoxy-7-phosphoheptulonate synthase [Desulfurococcaceae archaeon AG1]